MPSGAMYNAVDFFKQEFNRMSSNVAFRRQLLSFLELQIATGNTGKDQIRLNVDQILAIQEYLENSPPSFNVCYMIRPDHFVFANINSKVVLYQYSRKIKN
jgi:hypothetical protein